MTVTKSSSSSPLCPVCGGAGRLLLTLPSQSIYQHPVPAEAVVAAPYFVDLSWHACSLCAHAWQAEFDAELLESIYRSHYYTPAPAGIGVEFRNAFVEALIRFGVIGPKQVLLEIGASSGDVLAELKQLTGAAHAYAFEPNAENAAIARDRGLDVRESFFGAASGKGILASNLIYARHVIEHIFDFDDFFAGVNAVATADADLVLETPSLDFHARAGSVSPFHVEHIHVFSLSSLVTVARQNNWGLSHAEVSADGNLIAAFKSGRQSATVALPNLSGLQHALDLRRSCWQERLGDRPLVFWGAGSAGVELANLIGREPAYWTDGNPNKIGKKYPGLASRIVSPEQALAAAASVESAGAVLVIASSFAKEILPRVRQLGWTGEVVDLAGNLCA